MTSRKFKSTSENIGRLNVCISTEIFPGSPLLDTEVKIEAGTLCFISYPEKDQFIRELNAVINKYSI